ncbi:MAG: hypothetical protein JO318_07755 [Chloroflexi bacterium]|nr:hypothetical protein [Chloroflexota bacterium]
MSVPGMLAMKEQFPNLREHHSGPDGSLMTGILAELAEYGFEALGQFGVAD